MSYKLFIDDERQPPSIWHGDYVLAKTSQEAIATMVERGFPGYISFDHDLGGDDTTRPVVNWMIDALLDDPKMAASASKIKYYVHSQNPVGRDWLNNRMDDFFNILQMLQSYPSENN